MQEFRFPLVLKFILALIFSALIIGIGGSTPRDSFTIFIIQYSVVFAIYLLLVKSNTNLNYLLVIGLITRISLVFFTPELSNDFYRFIWDGELLLQGINPYDYKPNDLISYGQFLSNDYYLALHRGMGTLSQENYSCYPVINQFIFAFSASFSDNIITNTIVMKSIIILADIGTIWIGIKTLKLLDLPIKKIAWYFLNPLIILEFSGNLHFEGVMIFFLIVFIFFSLKNNWQMAGIFLALAVQIKLIPLMFMPFVFKKFGWKKAIGFTAVCILVILLISQLLISSKNINNFLSSLALYFDTFQFNASIFSWINIWYSNIIGWDTTSVIGPILGKIAIVLIVLLGILKAYKKPVDIFTSLTFALTIYYTLATTVHPWYISLILLFSIFTSYKFGILWSFITAASYFAYSNPQFIENKYLNSILYIGLFVYILFEIYTNWSKKTIGIQFREFFGLK